MEQCRPTFCSSSCYALQVDIYLFSSSLLLIFFLLLFHAYPIFFSSLYLVLCLDSRWKLLWEDDFVGTQLDPSKWTVCTLFLHLCFTLLLSSLPPFSLLRPPPLPSPLFMHKYSYMNNHYINYNTLRRGI